MIQRIQSIYLLVAMVSGFGLFLTAINTLTTNGLEFNFSLFGLHQTQGVSINYQSNSMALMVLNILFIALSILAIFMFKKRKRQILIANISIVTLIALCVSAFVYSNTHLTKIADVLRIPPNMISINYGIGALFPIVAIVFTFLAIRAIKKDEELVRSADRIR